MATSSDSTYPPHVPNPLVLREQDIEDASTEKLRSLKYFHRDDIRDRAALERNFRQELETLNRVRLTDGEFQRLLDDLIAAESRKLDALKAHKKGLMQQLFPAPEGAGA
jgi:type I restriction enzyme R subunit